MRIQGEDMANQMRLVKESDPKGVSLMCAIVWEAVQEGKKEAVEETKRDMAIRMIKKEMPIDEIIEFSGLSKDEVLKLQSSVTT